MLSETDVESLDVAMSMMGPLELGAVEDEVKVIQSNVRTWLLRKNYTNLRDAAKTLQVAWRGRERRSTRSRLDGGVGSNSNTGPCNSSHTLSSAPSSTSCLSQTSACHPHCSDEDEVLSTYSGMMSSSDTNASTVERGHLTESDSCRNASKCIGEGAATLRLQAATRGMLARRSFQRAKKQTMASLVIFQWWVQTNKSSGNNSSIISTGNAIDSCSSSSSGNRNSSAVAQEYNINDQDALDDMEVE